MRRNNERRLRKAAGRRRISGRGLGERRAISSIIKKIQVQTTTSDRFGRNFVKLADLRSVRIGQMSTAALHAMAKHWKQPRWSADKKTHE